MIRHRLSTDLRAAMKARDPERVGTLRSALSAISNAEAVPVGSDGEGAREGLRCAEAAPRELSETDVEQVIAGEIEELETAASQYETAQHPERAIAARRQAATLQGYLGR